MNHYQPSEIVDMLLVLGECHTNYREAARVYRDRYPDGRIVNHTTIRRLALRARQGLLRRDGGNHQYDENDNRVVTILGLIHLDPHVSSRTLAQVTGIPRTTILRILKNVKYRPYHITLTQALTPNDMRLRIGFCEWAQARLVDDPRFFEYVMFSDEACFQSSGHLNRHNSHYWSDVNPHWYRGIDNQHRWSVNVWCGIVNGHLVGPHFFNGTLTGPRFLEFLTDHLPGLLEDLDLHTRQRMWLQLDGAPPHYALIVRQYLNHHYPERWIGRGGPVAWPPRSPDLTSPDFFLWGFLRDEVFAAQPTTRGDMIDRIRAVCANIPRSVLLATVTNFQRRLGLCIQMEGDNFEQLL